MGKPRTIHDRNVRKQRLQGLILNNKEMKELLKLFIFWYNIDDCNKPLYQDQFDAAMMRAKELTKE